MLTRMEIRSQYVAVIHLMLTAAAFPMAIASAITVMRSVKIV